MFSPQDGGGIRWNKEAVLHLIDLYRANSCLWLVSSVDYRNKNAREDALNNILQKLEYIPHITKEDVKKKIQCLRDQFRREWRLLNGAKQPSDSNSGEQYRCKLWCAKELGFLADVLGSTSSQLTFDCVKSEVPVEDIFFQDAEPQEDLQCSPDLPTGANGTVSTPCPSPSALLPALHLSSPADTPTPPLTTSLAVQSTPAHPAHNRSKRKHEDNCGELVNVALKKLATAGSGENQDEFSDFGKVVANDLRRMNEEQQLFAKRIINDALFKGRMGTLKSCNIFENDSGPS